MGASAAQFDDRSCCGLPLAEWSIDADPCPAPKVKYLQTAPLAGSIAADVVPSITLKVSHSILGATEDPFAVAIGDGWKLLRRSSQDLWD